MNSGAEHRKEVFLVERRPRHTLSIMTVAAEKLLDVFETLTPDEQLFVREQVNQLTEGSQRLVIDRLRGASAGKQLLSKLIGDRQVERDRG